MGRRAGLRYSARPSAMKRLTAGGCGMTRSWIHFTRGRFVRQAQLGSAISRGEHLSRQGFAGPGRHALPHRRAERSDQVRRRLPAASSRQCRCRRTRCRATRAAPGKFCSRTAMSRSRSAAGAAMPYRYRDMEGDLLYFVHRGRGVFATEFGRSPTSRATGCSCRRRRRSGICRGRRQPVAGRRIAASDPPLASTSRSAATRRSTRRCWKCRTSPITAGRSRTNTKCG